MGDILAFQRKNARMDEKRGSMGGDILSFPLLKALFSATVICALTTIAYTRSVVWSSDISLWEDVVQKSHFSARAHNTLGVAYKAHGRNDEALQCFETALMLQPDYDDVYYNIGNYYANKGRIELSIEYYSKALTLSPGMAKAYNNRGLQYEKKGMAESAIADYSSAIRSNENHFEAYFNRANALFIAGELTSAIEDYTHALSINTDHADTYYNRGLAKQRTGNEEAAILDFRNACMRGQDAGCKILQSSAP